MSNMEFVFEDNPNMLTSLLLTEHAFNKKHIHFVGGNLRVAQKVNKLYDKNKIICVFLDYFPNNDNLNGIYVSTWNKIAQIQGYNDNVYLIPIPCFEYLLLRFLIDFGYIDYDNDLYDLIYDFKYSIVKDKYMYCNSLEKVYKACMNELDEEYYNVSKYRGEQNKNRGSFYEIDDLERKAEQFYTRFPVFEVVSEKHKDILNFYNIRVIFDTVDNILQRVIDYYMKVSREVGVKLSLKPFLVVK